MLVQVKNNISVILFSFIGFIIGIVVLWNSPKVDIWRVKYQFHITEDNQAFEYLKEDTLFTINGILIRNLNGLIPKDTVLEPFMKNELKLYLQPFAKKEDAIDFANDILSKCRCTITNVSFKGSKKDTKILLYYLFFGFYVGWIIEIISTKCGRNSKEKKQ